MARQAQSGFLRELVRNPLIIATASGLTANLLGFSPTRSARAQRQPHWRGVFWPWA